MKSEAYDMLEEETGLARDTVRQCRYVADQIDLGSREPSLSFKHHLAVAPLPPDDQKRWLQDKTARLADLQDGALLQNGMKVKPSERPAPGQVGACEPSAGWGRRTSTAALRYSSAW